MSKRKLQRNKCFNDVLMQRGRIFQSLASCATLTLCSSVVTRLISSAITPLESDDLPLAFQVLDHWNRMSIGCRAPTQRHQQTVTFLFFAGKTGLVRPYAPPPPPDPPLSTLPCLKALTVREYEAHWHKQMQYVVHHKWQNAEEGLESGDSVHIAQLSLLSFSSFLVSAPSVSFAHGDPETTGRESVPCPSNTAATKQNCGPSIPSATLVYMSACLLLPPPLFCYVGLCAK